MTASLRWWGATASVAEDGGDAAMEEDCQEAAAKGGNADGGGAADCVEVVKDRTTFVIASISRANSEQLLTPIGCERSHNKSEYLRCAFARSLKQL